MMIIFFLHTHTHTVTAVFEVFTRRDVASESHYLCKPPALGDDRAECT